MGWSVHDWATCIKVLAGLIMLGGVIDIISAFTAYKGTVWTTFVAGWLLLIVGARGLHAAFHGTVHHARQYLVSLIGTAIALIVCDIIGLAIANSWANDWCNAYNMTPQECDNLHSTLIASGIVGIVIAVLCCGCCVFAANGYYKALKEHDHHHGHTTVVVTTTGYQSVPSQPYPQTYPPQTYPPQSYPPQQAYPAQPYNGPQYGNL